MKNRLRKLAFAIGLFAMRVFVIYEVFDYLIGFKIDISQAIGISMLMDISVMTVAFKSKDESFVRTAKMIMYLLYAVLAQIFSML